MALSLEQSTELCSLLADSSRMRLLLLLEAHELTIAELTGITGLAQSRVSTHLSRLKRAGLVQDKRAGSAGGPFSCLRPWRRRLASLAQ